MQILSEFNYFIFAQLGGYIFSFVNFQKFSHFISVLFWLVVFRYFSNFRVLE